MSELASFSMWQWAFVVFLVLGNLIMPFLSFEPFKNRKPPTHRIYVFLSILFGLWAVVAFLQAFIERGDNAFREMVYLLMLVFTVMAATRLNEQRKVTK